MISPCSFNLTKQSKMHFGFHKFRPKSPTVTDVFAHNLRMSHTNRNSGSESANHCSNSNKNKKDWDIRLKSRRVVKRVKQIVTTSNFSHENNNRVVSSAQSPKSSESIVSWHLNPNTAVWQSVSHDWAKNIVWKSDLEKLRNCFRRTHLINLLPAKLLLSSTPKNHKVQPLLPSGYATNKGKIKNSHFAA